jgi:hypothetical protein
MKTYTAKQPTEIELFSVDFSDNLSSVETILSASSVMTIKSGIDPAVGTMVLGPAVINGSKVGQMVQGGVAGNYYYLSITIVTSYAQTIIDKHILPVVVPV